MNILVTGATGYIGGRLVPRLLDRGHRVRVLVRNPSGIVGRAWRGSVEVAPGSMEDPMALRRALNGIDAAYYLVHSMVAGRGFAERDRDGACNFADAARSTEGTLRHLIYLGGLLPHAQSVSGHLRSRAEVGEILRGRCPTTEFRAGPIIGSGSASFEMVRYLTERLPVMVAPRWILSEVQPIAIRDVLSYLLDALEKPSLGIVDIGADSLTFKRMMEVYGEVRGLRRIIFPVPVLAPTLAALWVGLVTPIPNTLAVPIIQGVIHSVLADTRRASELFSHIRPIDYRHAVELALRRIQNNDVETRWSGASAEGKTHALSDAEGIIQEVRSLRIALSPKTIYNTFCSLGGERGWLTWNWAWKIRGMLDKLAGGPGLRRGRRHPTELLQGESLDFWRVEAIVPDRLLRLHAEMRLPGKAWLQWEVLPEANGSRLVQTSLFAPTGLCGILYWYSLYPIHKIIFSALIRAVIREARKRDPGSTLAASQKDQKQVC